MQAQPTMVWGILCLGFMALMFVGMIVCSVLLLTSTADRRALKGLVTALLVVPVLLVLVFMGLFTARTVTVQQSATLDYEHAAGEAQHAHEEARRQTMESEVTTRVVSSHGDLSKLPSPLPSNDLFPATVVDAPADALVAMTSSDPAPVVPTTPNPTGDLRPDWLKKGVTKEGYVTTIVDCTGLFATEEEAERRVNGIVQRVIDSDLDYVAMRNMNIGFKATFIPNAAYSLYVKDRYVEVETRDLGAVTAPMYRIWLKMEQSPQTQARLSELYRPHVAAFRMRLVAILLAGFLAIPVGILVSGRGIRAMHGRGKWFWRAAGAALVLAVWAGAFYLLKLNAVIAL